VSQAALLPLSGGIGPIVRHNERTLRVTALASCKYKKKASNG
jgi:hypothetical protein